MFSAELTRQNVSRSYFLLSPEGEIGAGTPPKFGEKVARFFTFKQDGNLLAVNRKLVEMGEQLKDVESPIFNHLYVQQQQRFTDFQYILVCMNSKFESGNQHNAFSLLMLKILNFCRSVFGKPAIVFEQYVSIDSQVFNQVLERRIEVQILHENRRDIDEKPSCVNQDKPCSLHKPSVDCLEAAKKMF